MARLAIIKRNIPVKIFRFCTTAFVTLFCIYGKTSAIWLGDCNKPLGVSTEELPDEALTASSSHDHIVGPHRARLGWDTGGGAWCPRSPVDIHQTEWIEVNLSSLGEGPFIITEVGTQGRYAKKQGREYTQAYTLQYWRPHMHNYTTYTTTPGYDQVILEGNSDTYTEVRNELSRPILATKVRLLPYSQHPRVVCVRLELYGCNYTGGVDNYKVTSGHGGDKQVSNVVGEGVLMDGRITNPIIDKTPAFRNLADLSQGELITPGVAVEVTFEFTTHRTVSLVYLYLVPQYNGGTTNMPDLSIAAVMSNTTAEGHKTESINSRLRFDSKNPQNFSIEFKNNSMKYLTLILSTSKANVQLQEMYFNSEPCLLCQDTNPSSRKVTIPEERIAPLPPVLEHPGVWAVHTTNAHRTYVGVIVGFSVGAGLLIAVWVGVWLKRRKCKSSSPKMFRRPPPPDTLDMKSLMDGCGFTSNYEDTAVTSLLYDGGSLMADDSNQKSPLVPQNNGESSITVLPPRDYSISTLSSLKTANLACTEYASPNYLTSTVRSGRSEMFPPPLPAVSPPNQLPHRQQVSQILVPAIAGPWLTSIYRRKKNDELNIPGFCTTLRMADDESDCSSNSDNNDSGGESSDSLDALSVSGVRVLPPQQLCRAQCLASGAFATVSSGLYQPYDEDSPMTVALVSVTAHDLTPLVVAQAKILGSLDHKNICGLFGVVNPLTAQRLGVTLVLQYHPDCHLPDYLLSHALEGSEDSGLGLNNNNNTISMNNIVDMITQICDGMSYLEDRGIIHTDVAARNLLIHDGVIKITNMASALPRYSHDYWRPPDNRGPAPLRWISPESLCHGILNASSDVWSYGVTMWEVMTLCRRPPHYQMTNDQIFHTLVTLQGLGGINGTSAEYSHLQLSLVPPTHCPRELNGLMNSCWRTDPNTRPSFKTMLDFLQDYKHILVLQNASSTLARSRSTGNYSNSLHSLIEESSNNAKSLFI